MCSLTVDFSEPSSQCKHAIMCQNWAATGPMLAMISPVQAQCWHTMPLQLTLHGIERPGTTQYTGGNANPSAAQIISVCESVCVITDQSMEGCSRTIIGFTTVI